MWGQVEKSETPFMSCRIIPMRVGTRKEKSKMANLLKDHPHACGDKTKEIKENSGFAKSTA